MVVLYMFLLKALKWITVVQQNSHRQYQHQNHAHIMLCFTLFLSNDSKQDTATTDSHIKFIIELLKEKNIISAKLITIWGNTYGCAEHYRCDTALFLLSVLPQAFYVIIDCGVSAPGHIIEVVDGLKVTYKRFIFQLIYIVKLTGAKFYDTQW